MDLRIPTEPPSLPCGTWEYVGFRKLQGRVAGVPQAALLAGVAWALFRTCSCRLGVSQTAESPQTAHCMELPSRYCLSGQVHSNTLCFVRAFRQEERRSHFAKYPMLFEQVVVRHVVRHLYQSDFSDMARVFRVCGHKDLFLQRALPPHRAHPHPVAPARSGGGSGGTGAV